MILVFSSKLIWYGWGKNYLFVKERNICSAIYLCENDEYYMTLEELFSILFNEYYGLCRVESQGYMEFEQMEPNPVGNG